MKVSVVTVCRNAAKLLRPTLESVSRQCGVELELIVVDGASTDGSVTVIKDFAACAKFPVKWVSEADGGVYDALNKGISMASGDVVGLLHAGDRFASPDVLLAVVEAFGDGMADFVYGDVRYVELASGACRREYKADRFVPRLLLNGYAPPHPSLYVAREMLERVGAYNERYKVAADFEYFVRLMLVEHGSGRYLERVMVDMEPGGLSSRLANRLWSNNKEKFLALRENGFKVMPLRLLLRYLYL